MSKSHDAPNPTRTNLSTIISDLVHSRMIFLSYQSLLIGDFLIQTSIHREIFSFKAWISHSDVHQGSAPMRSPTPAVCPAPARARSLEFPRWIWEKKTVDLHRIANIVNYLPHIIYHVAMYPPYLCIMYMIRARLHQLTKVGLCA